MEAAVLIVEDEVLIAFHLQALVEQAGHRVTDIASDPVSALSCATASAPDFALMDVRLARGSSGLEAAKMLYERLGIRSLFLSANIDSDVRAQAEQLRPLGYLGKPFMAGDVLLAIQQAVRQLELDSDAQQRCSS